MSHKKLLLTAPMVCAAVFGTAALAAGPPLDDTFKCSGTEPFWSLSIAQDTMELKDLGTGSGAAVKMTKVIARPAAGTNDVRLFQSRLPKRPRDAVTVVVRVDASCSDGMSDDKYKYSVVYVAGSRVLAGCCNRR